MTSAGAALLEVSGLSVHYGKVAAVHGVSVACGEGRIVTVIGPNGAGKTTLLAAIMGLMPSHGEIRYLGESLVGLEVEQRVARGLVLVPEKRELFASMSVADNLALGAFARRRDGEAATRRTLDEVYHRFPRLLERRAQLAGTLSGGERQMLALGRALMGRPKLLMLDEPSLGLAPLVVREIFSIIVALREAGVSILLVEQNARAALQVSDDGYVLETGELVLSGPSAQLAANPRVAATYLGQGAGG
ncbi:MAG TPA: ABC transporter ATP-binding protein [Casimicrobiaceae bacterium]|jgi:branched-chain amino acid transport system ATP-binding protein|nr:ABC transporter ATP-binding protein [Casimicrobiaceae bacterium]